MCVAFGFAVPIWGASVRIASVFATPHAFRHFGFTRATRIHITAAVFVLLEIVVERQGIHSRAALVLGGRLRWEEIKLQEFLVPKFSMIQLLCIATPTASRAGWDPLQPTCFVRGSRVLGHRGRRPTGVRHSITAGS